VLQRILDDLRSGLAAFKSVILILQNNNRISCSFGLTKENDSGFWKYKATIPLVITYEDWFGKKYKEEQEIQIADSSSFTDGSWSDPAAS
jgi:hypothetical protein